MAESIRKLLAPGSLYATGVDTLDLRVGGNHGFSPRISEYLNNKAYIRRDLVPIVLSTPRMFTLMSDPKGWIEVLKAYVELHCHKIEGYNAKLTVQVAEQQIREEMQQDPTKVIRERSLPVLHSIEKEGNPIQKLHEFWITNGIMDPDTQKIRASNLENAPEDWLADWYSMSLLLFEPDVNFRYVRRAFVTVNMYPLDTGDILGSKDPNGEKDLLDLAIPYSGITTSNEGTRVFAQSV